MSFPSDLCQVCMYVYCTQSISCYPTHATYHRLQMYIDDNTAVAYCCVRKCEDTVVIVCKATQLKFLYVLVMQTPLHLAASKGRYRCLQVLLENKADMFLENSHRFAPYIRTPLLGTPEMRTPL